MMTAPFFGLKVRMLSAGVNFLAANQIGYQSAFLGRQAHATQFG